jgi:hypothetical protein
MEEFSYRVGFCALISTSLFPPKSLDIIIFCVKNLARTQCPYSFHHLQSIHSSICSNYHSIVVAQKSSYDAVPLKNRALHVKKVLGGAARLASIQAKIMNILICRSVPADIRAHRGNIASPRISPDKRDLNLVIRHAIQNCVS